MIYYRVLCLLGILATSNTLLPAGSPARTTEKNTSKALSPQPKLVDYSSSEDDDDNDTDLHKTPPRGTTHSPKKSPLDVTPATRVKITNKVTPQRRYIQTNIMKGARKNRVQFSATTANALRNSSLSEPDAINGSLHRQGLLVFHGRVLDRLSNQLCKKIAQLRNSNQPVDAASTESLDEILLQEELEHALSMEIIINAILMGRCSFQIGSNNQENLVIEAEVHCESNDSAIQNLLAERNAIKLIFGFAPGTTNKKGQFVLFHAMLHRETSSRYHERGVNSVKAVIDHTLYPGHATLRFEIEHAPYTPLPSVESLFTNMQQSLLKKA